jgi:hypothetical protein
MIFISYFYNLRCIQYILQLMRYYFLFLFSMTPCLLFAQDRADSIFHNKEYGFDQYPATPKKTTITEHELIYSKEVVQFKAEIRNAFKNKINFAGDCILVSWETGICRIRSAIINTSTRIVTLGPITCPDFIYYPNSKILIVDPADKNATGWVKRPFTHVYVWQGNYLKLLRSIPVPSKDLE